MADKEKNNKSDILALVGQIQHGFGEGSLKLMSDDPSMISNQENRISTGLYELDWSTGGGLVKGGIYEIFGHEGDGKTTLALTMLGHFQKLGAQGYIVDAEHKLNLSYAEALGVDVDNLLITQPNWGEQGLDIMSAVLQSGLVDVVIVDSVTALVPKCEIDGEFTDVNMGAHARLMSKMCRVLVSTISQHNILFIAINQIRMKLGVFFGSPETTTGGKALKFYSGMRFKVTSSQVKLGDSVDHTKRKVTVNMVKQQWGTPYRKIILMLNLGIGFDKGHDMLMYGLKSGIIQQKSSFYSMGKNKLGNGAKNAGQTLLLPEMQKIYQEGLDELRQRQNDNSD